MKRFRVPGLKMFKLRRRKKRRNGQSSSKHLTVIMSSAICQNFVQNAWKKDLCSNCFKSRDEHNQQQKLKITPVSFKKSVESIIRSTKTAKPKRSVEFTKELSQIIGFGGEDFFSDEEIEEELEDSDDDDDDEDVVEGDAEKELQKLTKANTEYNANLPVTVETGTEAKKAYTQLLLGKPQLNSEGKKQTLLVSVTPFGQGENTFSGISRKYTTPTKNGVSHIPIAKSAAKEGLLEPKNSSYTSSNVILTSYTTKNPEKCQEKSLLDEISETLENSKNPIQIMTSNNSNNNNSSNRKKTAAELMLSKPDIVNNKENIVNNGKIQEEADQNEKEGIMAKTQTSAIPEKKNGLTRTAVIKKDQEKPVIYQTSTAKIELMNTKNLNLLNTTGGNNKEMKKPGLTKLDDRSNGDGIKKDVRAVSEVEKVEEKHNKARQDLKDNADLKEEEGSDTSLTSTASLTSSSSEGSDKSSEEDVKKTPELVIPSQNREQPDGRADPEETEPPALPLTPPPTFESSHNSSFLHSQITKMDNKPKIPCKPSTIIIRKPITNTISPVENHPQPILTTFIPSENKVESNTIPNANHISNSNKPKFVKLEKHDSNNKRKAPKPPTIISNGSANSSSSEEIGIDEKKDRFSLMLNHQNNKQAKIEEIYNNSFHGSAPEPLPRRSLSLSSDNLLSQNEEKKKRARFSLKKFLRMGSHSKDLHKSVLPTNDLQQKPHTEDFGPAPQVKPRLVIVHPSELNGDKVEVVSKTNSNSCQDVPDYSNLPFVTSQNQYEKLPLKSETPKGMKPAPPPRNYEDYKPNLPHPPKSQEILNKQKEYSKNPNIKKVETVYANIGEVRSSLTPNKPHRTASMREREAQQQKRANNSYENVNVSSKNPNSNSPNENYYDYINNRSSSPECDTKVNGVNNRNVNGICLGQKSESNIDISSENYYITNKYQNCGMIPRSMSLTYCGSETESEIYSPYSFCGSESEVAEDEHEQWGSNNSGKTHKLRSKKGRSIVHKNLEDNYGAVVVANHEALAQVLENIQQNVTIQPALRGLKTLPNLRWNDFTIKGSAQSVIIGPRAFHQGIWGSQHVTLVISTGTVPTSSLSLGVYALTPVTEFSDLIPVQYLPEKPTDNTMKHLQATIAVLPWMQVHTIESYGELLKSKSSQSADEHWKDASFILLQLVNSLKVLQAQGIEELPSSLSSFVLCREVDKDTYYRLYVLQGLGEDMMRKNEDTFITLCSCASQAMAKLQVATRITSLIQNLLKNERAVSLTQTKSVLEFSLWGPSDVSLSNTIKEREQALQRWLDLQRATVLHGLVCTKVQLTVYEECHLLFLVRSTARMMSDASLLLESSNKQNGIIANGHK